MTARHSDKRRLLLAARDFAARSRGDERGDIARETAFCFELQKTRGIGFGELRNFRVRGQSPLERQRHNTATLADFRRIKMITDLAPDEFRRSSQRIERERDRKTPGDLQRITHALEPHNFESAAFEREAEQAVGLFLRWQFEIHDKNPITSPADEHTLCRPAARRHVRTLPKTPQHLCFPTRCERGPLALRENTALTRKWFNARPHPSPLPRGEGATFEPLNFYR